MLDEREGKVEDFEKDRSFNNQSLLKRSIIVFSGPLFNFILAVFFYFLIFQLNLFQYLLLKLYLLFFFFFHPPNPLQRFTPRLKAIRHTMIKKRTHADSIQSAVIKVSPSIFPSQTAAGKYAKYWSGRASHTWFQGYGRMSRGNMCPEKKKLKSK